MPQAETGLTRHVGRNNVQHPRPVDGGGKEEYVIANIHFC